jgi:hypothetical protein
MNRGEEMKVTLRVALAGVLAAAIIVQTVSATSFSVMRRGAYYMPEMGSGNVADSTRTGADTSGTFIETCRKSTDEVAVDPGFSSAGAWEDVTVCSTAVGDDPIRRYADPSFWAITGSPVQNLDFLFSDKAEEGRQNSRFALDNTSMAEQQCVVRSEHTYSSGRFCLADGAGSGVNLAQAGWGTGY